MRTMWGAVAIAVLLAACEPGAPPRRAAPSTSASPTPTPRPTHDPDPALPYEGEWKLVSGTSPRGPIPLSEDYPISLGLRARFASGYSTCNEYGGRYWITGTRFTPVPGKFYGTQAGCANDVLLRAENRYFASLVDAEEIYADDTTLRLTGPDVELVYERVPRPDLDALTDVTWVSGDRTLRLSSDGTFRATSGCAVFTGKWDFDIDRIFVPESRLARDCPGIRRSALESGYMFEVKGDRLILTFGRRSTIFRRE